MANPQVEDLSFKRFNNGFKLQYSSLKRLCVCPSTVVFGLNRGKVLRSIVGFYAVKVVNNVSFWKKAAVCLFPNKNMLFDIIGIINANPTRVRVWMINLNVTTSIYPFPSLPIRGQLSFGHCSGALVTKTSFCSSPMDKSIAITTPDIIFNFPLPVPFGPLRYRSFFWFWWHTVPLFLVYYSILICQMQAILFQRGCNHRKPTD